MFRSKYFCFLSSLPFHQCSILISTFAPERQAGQSWEPSNKATLFGGFRREHWIVTYLDAISSLKLASRGAPTACSWPRHFDNHGPANIKLILPFLVLTEVNPNICVCVCVCVCVYATSNICRGSRVIAGLTRSHRYNGPGIPEV